MQPSVVGLHLEPGDGSARRSHTRLEPSALPHARPRALADLFLKRLGATEVDFFPETFEWRDGFDGRELMHIPLLLVRWGNDGLTFVDAMRRDDLVRDPELSGTRRRIEAECLARGAAYEIWTETEAARMDGYGCGPRPAGRSLRTAYRDAMRALPEGVVPVPGTAAAGLGFRNPLVIGGTWVGCSVLTGIPKVLGAAIGTVPDLLATLRRDALAASGRVAAPRRRSQARGSAGGSLPQPRRRGGMGRKS